MAVPRNTASRPLRADQAGPSGREPELRAALDLLSEPSVRLVTFTGPAGVGKTWLTGEVARHLAESGDGCVVPVHVENARTCEDLVRAVASALDLPPGWAPLEDRLAAALTAEPHVLVLDGCELFRGDPHPVRLLLRQSPSMRVLATSLRPLRLEGEHVIGLDPFHVPPVGATVEELRDNPAVRLFLRRAAESHHGFRPEGADLRTVAELCRRVHGLPLGIEILAARAGTESAEAVLDHLDSGQEVALPRTRGAGSARHLSLREALNWSYSMLDPHAARLLRRMSVFAGPATVEMLTEVVAAVPGKGPGARPSYSQVLDLVSTLVDHRLVEPFSGQGEPAFTSVALLKDFALERLIDEGEQAWAEEARIRAVLAFVLARWERLEHGGDGVTVGELVRSEDDLRWVLRRLVGRAQLHDGLRLAASLAPFVLRRGYDGFVAPALASLLRRARAKPGAVDDVLVAGAMLWKARLAAEFDGPSAADAVTVELAEALAMARRNGDPRTTLLGLSFVLETVPVTLDVSGAASAAAEGIRLAEAARDESWSARFYAWGGLVASHAGDVAEAVRLARRAMDLVDACHEPRAQMLLAMLVPGLPAEEAEVLKGRLPPLEEMLAKARSLHDSAFEPFVLRIAVGEALRQGDLQTAARHCAACLRLSQRQAAWHDLPYALMLLVLIAAARRNHVEVALFHGMAQSLLDIHRPMPPAPWYAGYPAAIATARAVLGDRAFETLSERGQADMHTNAVAVPLTYAESVAGLNRRSARGAVGTSSGPTLPEELTPREEQVLVELSTGATNKQISARLGMTPKTVMHHSVAIYRKLGVRGRAEATAWAFRHGVAR
jgi:predicted ATPase/DNA-binding CsgD family transcriptional regulator